MEEDELILETLGFILEFVEGSLLIPHSHKEVLQARRAKSLLFEVRRAKRELERQKIDGASDGDDPSWDYYN